METDELTMRLEELLAAREMASQEQNPQMMEQIQSGIAQVAGQMQQAGIEDPEAALWDLKARRVDEEQQRARMQQATTQANQLGQQQGQRQGYEQGYNAGNPVGAAAKKLAASMFGEQQQGQQ